MKSEKNSAVVFLLLIGSFIFLTWHIKQDRDHRRAALVGKTYVMHEQGIIGMSSDTTYVVLEVPNEISNLITDDVIPVAISGNDIKTVLYEVKVNADGSLRFIRTRSLVKR